MKPLTILLFIFLSSCGIVHIEIRDKRPAQETKKAHKETKPSTAVETRKEETPSLQRENLRVQLPVRGRLTKTERGYYITTSCGEFYRSVSDGKVLYSGDDIRGYGWVVMVESEDGLVYVYAKAESSLVKRGERVKRGQPLGRVGNSQEGCGLLFEIRDQKGKPISFEPVL